MCCLWLPLSFEYLGGSIFWKWRRYFHFMRSNFMFMWQNRVHLGKVVKRWSGTILHCATISPSPSSWYLTIPSVDTFLGRPSEDVICFAADAGVHFAWSAERGRRGEQNSANCVLKTHFSHSRKYVFPGKLQQHRFWINMPLPYIKDYKLAMLLKNTQ